MSAINADKSRGRVEAFTRKHRIALLTMLFTDVVGSTQLKLKRLPLFEGANRSLEKRRAPISSLA